MSNTWADRHRILLMTQTRRRLKNLGYSAGRACGEKRPPWAPWAPQKQMPFADDMPKLFKKFDRDGNGELEMEEFCEAVAAKWSLTALLACRGMLDASHDFIRAETGGKAGLRALRIWWPPCGLVSSLQRTCWPFVLRLSSSVCEGWLP